MAAPFVDTFRVRYHECDRQGVVFNANYLAYFDIALTGLWRAAFGSYDSVVARGGDVVVAEAKLRFRGSARFDDEIDVVLAITHIGDSSIVSRQEVRRAGELLVEGEMRHVWVQADTLRRASIPDWARQGLAPWVVPETTATVDPGTWSVRDSP